jgi:hypothetical protein
MKNIIIFGTCLLLTIFPCSSHEWKIEKSFFISSGIGRGQIGPSIKDRTVLGRGDTDQPWGVSGLGIDGSGNIILLDNMNKKLLIFTEKGKLIDEIQGIGGLFENGFPSGKIINVNNRILIYTAYSITVFDKQTKNQWYRNIWQYGAPYDSAYLCSILDGTAFYWDRRFFWCIPDIFDPNSQPIELKLDHEILKKTGIKEKNGVYYLSNDELLFKNFSIYQSINSSVDVNKGIDGDFLGTWNGINVWINNGTDIILGPIGKASQMKRVIDETMFVVLANVFFSLSPNGYVYFTNYSVKQGGTIVSRLDLHPFLEEE